ncbi:MAG: hypothetical protein WBW33_28775 [Bryobacteraceae bacterium]
MEGAETDAKTDPVADNGDPAQPAGIVTPQSCPSCGNTVGPRQNISPRENMPMLPVATFVYAVGRIEPRFPRLSVEKEFAQATGRAETTGLTDRQVLHQVLSQRHNRYLARQLCWVLTIEGLDTYLLHPRDPADLDLLIETLRPNPREMDIDVVIGVRGPIAPPDACNGLTVPIVLFDQVYSFDRAALINGLPRPKDAPEEDFRRAAGELFDRIMLMADNAGATDEHRALNYLAVRYPPIYANVRDAFHRNLSLTSVEVRPSALSGARKVVEVVFSFTNRTTDVMEAFFVRVDVTEEFPFLVTKMSPFFNR